MAIFNFGGSKQKSSSQASGSEFGFGFSTGFSESGSQSGSRTRQNIAFEDIFAQLYGNASTTAGLVPSINTQAEALFSGGLDFFDMLESGGPGASYLEGRLTDDNALLNEQIGLLGEDLGKFFEEQINPAIREEFIGGGGLGGTRQAVATGQAVDPLAQAFARGSAELRIADQAAKDTLAGELLTSATARGATGIQGAGSLFQLAQSGALSDLAPYQALASILGGPTVLTEADSASIARALSEQFGLDLSSSKYQSTSSSSGKSFSLGFG